MVSTIESAISSRACSQEMRFHFPEPRSPARFSGYCTRHGSYMRSLKQAPFWQPRGLKSGTCSLVWG